MQGFCSSTGVTLHTSFYSRFLIIIIFIFFYHYTLHCLALENIIVNIYLNDDDVLLIRLHIRLNDQTEYKYLYVRTHFMGLIPRKDFVGGRNGHNRKEMHTPMSRAWNRAFWKINNMGEEGARLFFHFTVLRLHETLCAMIISMRACTPCVRARGWLFGGTYRDCPCTSQIFFTLLCLHIFIWVS